MYQILPTIIYFHQKGFPKIVFCVTVAIPQVRREALTLWYSCLLLLQLYTDRLKMVKKEKERDLWLSINCNFMTDESEVETEDPAAPASVIKHCLPWRSNSQVLFSQFQDVGCVCNVCLYSLYKLSFLGSMQSIQHKALAVENFAEFLLRNILVNEH